MPDKSTNQQDLVSRGWQQMSDILDREMPQRKKRRWVAWLPWGVAGVVALLVVAWWATGSPADINHPDEQSPIEARQQSATSTSADATILPSEDIGSLDARRATTTDSRDVSTQSIVDNGATAAGSNATKIEVGIPEDDLISQPRIDDPSNQNTRSGMTDEKDSLSGLTGRNITDAAKQEPDARLSQIVQADVVDAEELALTENPTVSEESAAAPLRQALTISAIPVRQTELSDNDLPLMPAIEVQRHKHNALHGYAFGNTHFNTQIGLRGLEGGLALGYDFSNRWAALIGVSYGYYTNDPLFRLGSFRQAEEDLAANSGGTTTPVAEILGNGIVSNSIGYDTAQILTDKYKYVHVPVSVQYQLTNWLSVGAGARISRLLSAPSEYGLEAVESNFTAGDFNYILAKSGDEQNFLYDFDLVRKFEVAPMLAMVMDLGRLTTLDINYQHGFTPVIAQSDVPNRKDYNRTFSIGVRRRLF